jgi:hypothetical protein
MPQDNSANEKTKTREKNTKTQASGRKAAAPRPRGRERAGGSRPSEADIAAESASIYPDTFATPPSADEIAAEAYAIYRSRGGEHGRDQDDWLEAERRLADRGRKSRT